MTVFDVVVTNDHGHLLIQDDTNLPAHIRDFVYDKANLYCAPKYEKCGKYIVRMYEMKPNCKKQWKYQCGQDVVRIDFKI